jgi:two-component system, OmpR family, sensor kinase
MSLRATLLLALAYVLLLALIALGVPLAVSLRDRVDSEVRGQARSQADVVAASASELLEPGRRAGLRSLAEVSADSVRGRVIVVDRRGRLLADSAGAPVGRDYASRPEVRAALRGHSEQITRNSSTLGTEILATAVPVLEHGRPGGAVRITQSVAAVNRAVRTSLLDLAALAGIVLLLALAAGALIARRIALPIRRLDEAARRVAGGDLDTAVSVEGSSEQRSLGRAFNEMTQRIRRLLRVQQDFVADASHQLRTPLTGLRLRLENLAAREPAGGAPARELDAAMGEIDRLSQIVDELLILSRAGEHELPGERIDLGEAARRAAERWRDAGRERGISVEAGSDGAAGVAWCARPDLDRSIDALVENALRYSPAGSTVTIAAAPGRIEVLDEGPGLEPGEEEAVFERFSRGSAGRRGSRGTGLGLPIARELTRQWGGEVSLENRGRGGLRAVIEVPER